MKIAIDTRPVAKRKAGIGQYVFNIVKKLSEIDKENEYILFGGPIKSLGKNFRQKRLIGKIQRIFNTLWKRIYFPPIEWLVGKVDLVHFTNFVVLPTFAKRIILNIYDLSYLAHPEFAEKKNLTLLKKFVPVSIEKATKIITISKFSKSQIIKHFKVPEDKIFVIYPAANEEFKPLSNLDREKVKRKYKLEKDFILYLGTLEPRKNVETLIKAYNELPLIKEEFDLVIAGERGWLYSNIFKLVKKLYLEDKIKFLGYVSDQERVLLYNLATVFVFPSFYEGFGMPPLEAMACGTPVICSNTSSLPEVCEDAALYIDPYNLDDLKEALSKLLTDESLRKKLAGLGFEQARKFSWLDSAKKTLEVYRIVYSGYEKEEWRSKK